MGFDVFVPVGLGLKFCLLPWSTVQRSNASADTQTTQQHSDCLTLFGITSLFSLACFHNLVVPLSLVSLSRLPRPNQTSVTFCLSVWWRHSYLRSRFALSCLLVVRGSLSNLVQIVVSVLFLSKERRKKSLDRSAHANGWNTIVILK